MVFSSVPLYLDPPNWQQHSNQQQLQGPGNENQHLMQPQQAPQHPPHMGGAPGPPQIRPNSMAERARLAKIPPPEAPLKCPRCDSSNTKFCYFNNYSLSQPRHFCKTCRRYWTRGGALRNVPVGGGCRRNKRSSSKSSSTGCSGGASSSSKSSLSSPTNPIGGGHLDIVSSTGLGPAIPGIPSGSMTSFMASLQNIAQIGMGNLGLTFGGSLPPLGVGGIDGLSGSGDQHHSLDYNTSNLLNHPQTQFSGTLGGAFEVPGGALYSSSFQGDHQQGGLRGDGGGESDNHLNVNVNVNGLGTKSCSTMLSQLAPVKMEGGPGQGQGLNLKQLMGISSTSSHNVTGNNQFWGGGIGNTAGGANMWTDLSGLNSSSSSHLL